jgi:hypothetical protein
MLQALGHFRERSRARSNRAQRAGVLDALMALLGFELLAGALGGELFVVGGRVELGRVARFAALELAGALGLPFRARLIVEAIDRARVAGPRPRRVAGPMPLAG